MSEPMMVTEMKPGAVHANLVVGENWATSLGGKSAPLSSGTDRERFHNLRKGASVIIIGGATARCEPYGKTPCRLVVLSRSGDLGRAATNPLVEHSSEDALSRIAHERGKGEAILIEAGAQLLSEVLHNGAVDYLHLTRTPINGDGGYLDPSLLERYEIVTDEPVGDERYQIWKLRASD